MSQSSSRYRVTCPTTRCLQVIMLLGTFPCPVRSQAVRIIPIYVSRDRQPQFLVGWHSFPGFPKSSQRQNKERTWKRQQSTTFVPMGAYSDYMILRRSIKPYGRCNLQGKSYRSSQAFLYNRSTSDVPDAQHILCLGIYVRIHDISNFPAPNISLWELFTH